MAEKLYDVFISHASQDKNVAEAIAHHFESLGIRCFLAKDRILPGASWAGELTMAIRQSQALLLITSKHSNSSENVRKEIGIAASAGVHIVQFKLEQVELNPTLEYHLEGKHWLDAIDPPMATRIQELGDVICRLLKIEPRGPFKPDKEPEKGKPGTDGGTRPQWGLLAAGIGILLLPTLGWIWTATHPKKAEPAATSPVGILKLDAKRVAP